MNPPVALGKAKPRQAIAGAEHFLVEEPEASPQTPKFPILGSGWKQPAVIRSDNLAEDRFCPLPIDEDGRSVGFATIAPAAGLPAAAGESPDAPPEERLVAAEGAEDGGELGQEPIELLPIAAWIVADLGHCRRPSGESDIRILGRSK